MKNATVVELVGLQRPRRDGEERQREQPPQRVLGHHAAHPVAGESGERVVGERGDEDAGDDRPRLLEARGQDQRQELRLVPQFADGDDGGGDEEGFEHGGGKGIPTPAGRVYAIVISSAPSGMPPAGKRG
jgi:hypothetical protein